jgi:phosphonate transport system ATP-binding protein
MSETIQHQAARREHLGGDLTAPRELRPLAGGNGRVRVAGVQDRALASINLSKVYPNGTRALDDVTLRVEQGDFVAIIGSSGAGKSTFLRCLNRLIRPTAGTIYLFGEDVTQVSGRRLRGVRRRAGMIFQQFNLVRRLTVIENVLVGRLRFTASPLGHCLTLARKFSRRERELAFDCLKQVGIENLAFQRADQLSGGQQQRVAIARALAQEPEVFLADEPIASLDPRSAETVMETLQRIHETRKMPVLVNLHHIDFAQRYAKRVVGMARGRLVFDGGPGDIDEDLVANIYGPKLGEAFGEPACVCA